MPTPTVTATPSLNGSDWSQHKKGSVTASGSCGELSAYQMELTLHYGSGTSSGSDIYLASNASSNFSDIRFTKADGETLLDYWIEEYTANDSAIVWVEFADISTAGTDFYIYYGNPAAESAINGSDTFIIFNDGSSIDGWSKNTGGADWDWSPTNGVIRCTSNQCSACGAWTNLYCNTTIGTNYYVVESEIRAQDSNTSKNYQQGLYGGGYPVVRWLENANWWQIQIGSTANYSNTDDTFNASQWHNYKFVKNGSNYCELFVDSDSKVTNNATNSYQKTGMYVWIDGDDHWVEFDDFRVSKYCYPEPEWGVWAEAYPTPTPTTSPTPTESPTP